MKESAAQTGKKFSLGELVATTNFVHRAKTLGLESDEIVTMALQRHLNGDWGDCCDEDGESNNQALKNDERLLSVYHMKDEKFWVITEWDRSVTTILLPEDY